uniref:NR LBD domain-containing protein n=1 Tax=Plectus sambesii TaxID=2011161 RepID=A0A914WJS2_9BILA
MLASPSPSNTLDINKLLSLEDRLRQLRVYDLPMRPSLIDSLTQPSLFDAPEVELSIHIIQNCTLTQQTLTQAHHACDTGLDVSLHPEDDSEKTREDDASEMTSITAKIIDRLVLPMRAHRIDMTEVALLRVLLFLDPEQDYITSEAREALEEERRKYFSHFLEYVQKKHYANGPQRFGFILLLSNALQQIATDKKRALLTFDIFAAISENNPALPESMLENKAADHGTATIPTTLPNTSCTNH